jgi:glycosyltransferase involved in cell wall biosynthesis
MVNCATREALPNSFIEASAAKCAILSYVNPDNFASNFGFHAKNDNFEEGLNWLLENNRWQEKGEMGYRYIREKFQMDQVIQKHIDIYKDILKNSFR